MDSGIVTVHPDLEEYRAGDCNIGRQEVAKRQAFAFVGAAATVGWLVATTLIDAPPPVRALAGLPAAGAFLSWYEAKRRFCVTYATLGLYRLGPANRFQRITDRSARLADLRALAFPLLGSAMFGLLVAALTYLLP